MGTYLFIGIFIFISGLVIFIATNSWVSNFCPNCGRSTLILIDNIKTPTGDYKRQIMSRGIPSQKTEIVQEKKSYRCYSCGFQFEKEDYEYGKELG